jgi:hypothetical protein
LLYNWALKIKSPDNPFEKNDGGSMSERRFTFGRNWQNFIEKNFSEKRVDDAKQKLLDLLGLSTLAGLSFLDIGCGSGIHSLAALRAGAQAVWNFGLICATGWAAGPWNLSKKDNALLSCKRRAYIPCA